MDCGHFLRPPRPFFLESSGPGIPPPIRSTGAAPIVLNGMMGAASQHYFDQIRRAHFPVPHDAAPAHITLFRHLPPSAADEISHRVRAIAAEYRAFEARLGAPYLLERGVAFALHSPDLHAIWHRLAQELEGLLIGSDQAEPHFHVTVQNHRPRAEARALLAHLQKQEGPSAVPIIGLTLSRHSGSVKDRPDAIKFRGRRRAY